MPEFDAEVTTTVSVEFEVYCSCGEGLCLQSTTRNSRNRNVPQVVVEPCQKCISNAKETGYDDGYQNGYEEAENAN